MRECPHGEEVPFGGMPGRRTRRCSTASIDSLGWTIDTAMPGYGLVAAV